MELLRSARPNTPSQEHHLHFRLLDPPDLFAGRSLPFVIDRFTLAGTVDLANSEADRLVITLESREVRRAYPLNGGIQNFPLCTDRPGRGVAGKQATARRLATTPEYHRRVRIGFRCVHHES